MAVFQRLGIELGLGHVENASTLLAEFATLQQAEGLERTPLLQLLKYQTAVQAGRYKAAGEAWEEAAGRGIGAFDKFPPAGPTVDRAVVLETAAALLGLRRTRRPTGQRPWRCSSAPRWCPRRHCIWPGWRSGVPRRRYSETGSPRI